MKTILIIATLLLLNGCAKAPVEQSAQMQPDWMNVCVEKKYRKCVRWNRRNKCTRRKWAYRDECWHEHEGVGANHTHKRKVYRHDHYTYNTQPPYKWEGCVDWTIGRGLPNCR